MLTEAERSIVSEFAMERPTDIDTARRLLAGRGRARTRQGLIEVDEQGLPSLRSDLGQSIAAVVSGFLDSETVSAIAHRVANYGRADPLAAPVSAYGAAFFMHVGQDEDAYFSAAGAARALFEELAPGVSERMLEWACRFAGSPVEAREGWAGPGAVVMDTAMFETEIGDIHFDWEGLAAHPTARLGNECYSLLCLIQAPESGTSLRVWDEGLQREGDDGSETKGASAPTSVTIDYRPGDLLVIDSLSLHQILLPQGRRPRIMLTAHLAWFPEGWRLWL